MQSSRRAKLFLGMLTIFSCGLARAESPTEPARVPTATETAAAQGWQNESELGITVAAGNASAETYQVKQSTRYLWDMNVARLSGHYLYGLANSREAARNWDIAGRYERLLGDRFAAFLGNTWEGDPFIGFNYRTSADVGMKYYVIPGDKKVDYLATELGYRFMYEERVAGVAPPTLTSHVSRVYAEGVAAINEMMSARFNVEALPDLAQTDNFQLNFEASIAATMNSNLSLKLGYGGKFRNLTLGAGKKKYDSLVLAALIAKF